MKYTFRPRKHRRQVLVPWRYNNKKMFNICIKSVLCLVVAASVCSTALLLFGRQQLLPNSLHSQLTQPRNSSWAPLHSVLNLFKQSESHQDTVSWCNEPFTSDGALEKHVHDHLQPYHILFSLLDDMRSYIEPTNVQSGGNGCLGHNLAVGELQQAAASKLLVAMWDARGSSEPHAGTAVQPGRQLQQDIRNGDPQNELSIKADKLVNSGDLHRYGSRKLLAGQQQHYEGNFNNGVSTDQTANDTNQHNSVYPTLTVAQIGLHGQQQSGQQQIGQQKSVQQQNGVPEGLRAHQVSSMNEVQQGQAQGKSGTIKTNKDQRVVQMNKINGGGGDSSTYSANSGSGDGGRSDHNDEQGDYDYIAPSSGDFDGSKVENARWGHGFAKVSGPQGDYSDITGSILQNDGHLNVSHMDHNSYENTINKMLLYTQAQLSPSPQCTSAQADTMRTVAYAIAVISRVFWFYAPVQQGLNTRARGLSRMGTFGGTCADNWWVSSLGSKVQYNGTTTSAQQQVYAQQATTRPTIRPAEILKDPDLLDDLNLLCLAAFPDTTYSALRPEDYDTSTSESADINQLLASTHDGDVGSSPLLVRLVNATLYYQTHHQQSLPYVAAILDAMTSCWALRQHSRQQYAPWTGTELYSIKIGNGAQSDQPAKHQLNSLTGQLGALSAPPRFSPRLLATLNATPGWRWHSYLLLSTLLVQWKHSLHNAPAMIPTLAGLQSTSALLGSLPGDPTQLTVGERWVYTSPVSEVMVFARAPAETKSRLVHVLNTGWEHEAGLEDLTKVAIALAQVGKNHVVPDIYLLGPMKTGSTAAYECLTSGAFSQEWACDGGSCDRDNNQQTPIKYIHVGNADSLHEIDEKEQQFFNRIVNSSSLRNPVLSNRMYVLRDALSHLPGQPVAVDASPSYLHAPNAPIWMYLTHPKPHTLKFIVYLRNSVTRMYSHWSMIVNHNHEIRKQIPNLEPFDIMTAKRIASLNTCLSKAIAASPRMASDWDAAKRVAAPPRVLSTGFDNAVQHALAQEGPINNPAALALLPFRTYSKILGQCIDPEGYDDLNYYVASSLYNLGIPLYTSLYSLEQMTFIPYQSATAVNASDKLDTLGRAVGLQANPKLIQALKQVEEGQAKQLDGWVGDSVRQVIRACGDSGAMHESRQREMGQYRSFIQLLSEWTVPHEDVTYGLVGVPVP